MSAEQIGANLLGEVEEDSLASLLSDLRYVINPYPKSALAFPALDEILESFRFPSDPSLPNTQFDATSTDLRNATFSDDWEEYHPGAASPNRGPTIRKPKPVTINIACNSSRSFAEVNLLYYLTTLAILPAAQGGNESTVLWLDTRHSFSAARLYQIAFTNVRHKFPNVNVSTASAVVRDSLKHVHVVNVSSSRNMLSTLSELPSYLLQSKPVQGSTYQHHSKPRPLSLLILDSATQFHWQDRFDAEITRLEALSTANIADEPGNNVPGTSTNPLRNQNVQQSSSVQILAGLKEVQSRFDCAVIYTTNPLSTSSNASVSRIIDSGLNTSHHSPLYEQPVTTDVFTSAALITMDISRLEVPQFAAQMSLDECMRDRAKRQEVVSRGAFRVSVNPGPGIVSGITSGPRRTAGTGNGFVMRVTEREGVVIEPS